MAGNAVLPLSPPTSSPRPPNQASAANIAHRSFFCACGIATSAVIAVAIVMVTVHLSERHRRRRLPSDEETSSFCCPHEVEQMSRYVNASLDPCQDFFAYVCSSDDDVSHAEYSDLAVEHERAIVTGAMPNGLRIGKAGHFLNTYYKTCVQIISQPELLTASLTKALILDAGDLLEQVNSRNLLIFSMTASIKYFLPSVIRITFEPGNSNILFEVTPICYIDPFFNALTAVVDVLNGKNSTKLTTQEMTDFARMLCELFEQDDIVQRSYLTTNETDAFNREVWNIDDLESGFIAHGMLLQNVDAIEVHNVHQMRLYYEILPEENSKKKAAYLLWHSVAMAVLQFQSSSALSWPQVFEVCNKSLSEMFEIQGRFKAEILTNRDKDAESNAIFATIKDSMEKEWQKGVIFAPENASVIKRFFTDAELLTPAATKINPIPVPKPTKDFAENLLMGRAYNYYVRLELISTLDARMTFNYGYVTIVEGRYIVLHASFYSLIRADSPRSRLPNMALLGQLLAETFWYSALYLTEWDPKTIANFHSLKTCFAENYLPNYHDDYEIEMILLRALGLSSVLRALNLPDWYVEKAAWSLEMLSHAQFFHMYSTYNSCPKNPSPQLAYEINAALKYAEDFSKAFRCSLDAPMSKRVDCTRQEITTKSAHKRGTAYVRRRNIENLRRERKTTDWRCFRKGTFLPNAWC